MEKTVKILSIDDDEDIRFALDELFKLQGWRAVSAGTVEEGLEIFKELGPDLVLMDYHMPGINGVEGVKLLRRLSDCVPIIVFTIDESQEAADVFLNAGATDFALKPIKAPDIVSRIRLHLKLLDRRREQREELLVKGLTRPTMDLIMECFPRDSSYMTVNEIAADTGLAYQTVIRYLQYLTQEKKIEVVNVYGKVGRPRQLYRPKDGNLR